jgi:hypothetical protein
MTDSPSERPTTTEGCTANAPTSRPGTSTCAGGNAGNAESE